MLHVLLPSQHLPRRGRTLGDPQRRLMLAVLQTVVDDVQAACNRTGPAVAAGGARACSQALAYVESHDRSWPFSFENICETIGLDADGIRRTIRDRVPPQAAG